ncbi:MAG: rod shape-determining protein MreC [Bacteroidota bacterium]
MRFLLAFLKKYAFFFLFLVLEAVALLWMLNRHDYQRSIFSNASSNVAGSMFEVVNNIADYANLGRENKKLLEENKKLRNALQAHKNQYPPDTLNQDTLTYVTRDSLQIRKFVYEPVNFIHNSVHKPNNYLMIDKGSKDSIFQDMGLINSQGVVGIVINTSNNYGWAMSMLNSNIKISAMLKHNQQMGTAEWDGQDYRYGILSDIPAHSEVNKGDTIVTSGYSQVFPEGVLIGHVEKVTLNEGINMYSIRFRFAADFNSLDYGYVIKNLFIDEIDSISDIEKPIIQ